MPPSFISLLVSFAATVSSNTLPSAQFGGRILQGTAGDTGTWGVDELFGDVAVTKNT